MTALRQKSITAKVGPSGDATGAPATSGRCGGMHARSTTIKADPDNLDAGIAFTRDEVMPAIQQIDGCIGLSMLTDRESGRCIVTTSWADADAMRAATEDVHPIRLMQALGAQGLDIQEWEIAVLHRERPAGDGAGAQVTWARIPPNHLNELLDAYRHNLMPQLQDLMGFDSLSMLVDRRTGRTVSVTAFETCDALALFRRHAKHAKHLREQFAQAMGARITDIAEMDLAVAHLRVPETV